MGNMNKLRGKMAEIGTTIAQLAERIGVDRHTLGKTLAGKRQWCVGEAFAIVDALHLSGKEANAIFFADD